MITFSISTILLIFLRKLYKNQIFIFFFDFIGTFLHELSHFAIGLFTMAQPVNFSILPKSENGYLVLGSVQFMNVRFFNAIPIGLAPLLLIIPIIYIPYHIYNSCISFYISIFLSFIFTSLLFSFLPSSQDYKVAFSNFFGVIFYAIIILIVIYSFLSINMQNEIIKEVQLWLNIS